MKVLMPLLVILVVAGVFALVVSMFRRTRQQSAQEQQDANATLELAKERKWTHEQATYGLVDELCGEPPLPVAGRNLRAMNYITGDFRGRTFRCFHHTTGTTDVDDGRNIAVFWSMFAMRAPGTGAELMVRRPQALDGVTQRGRSVPLGMPEFDEAFRVLADDEAYARTVLAGLAPFLAADPRAVDLVVRVHGDEVLTWYKGRLSPHRIDECLGFLGDVLDRIPARAWTSR